MTAIVAERGQVTIPKKLREQLGISPRTVLSFEEDQGHLLVTKVVPGDAVSQVLGCVRPGRKTDAIIRDMRGDA